MLVIKMNVEVKEIKTSYGEYEVYQNCIPVNTEKEDVFSCRNDCLHCLKQCDVGLTFKKEVIK